MKRLLLNLSWLCKLEKTYFLLLFLFCGTLSLSGQISPTQIIHDPSPVLSGDAFGSRIAHDGDILVIASRSDDSLGVDTGIAFVFENINGDWERSATLVPSDPEAGLLFGHEVVIKGDVIALSAPKKNNGRIYVFEKPINGWAGTLTETVQISPSNATGYFGNSIDLDNNHLLIGHIRAYGTVGHTYLYKNEGLSWGDQNYDTLTLTSASGSYPQDFGYKVKLSLGDELIFASSPGESKLFMYNLPGVIQDSIVNTTVTNYLQVISGSFGQSYAGQVDYADSTLMLHAYVNSLNPNGVRIYRLNASKSFVYEKLASYNPHYKSISLSSDGKISASINADQTVQFSKKSGLTTWDSEPVIVSGTLPDLSGTQVNDGFLYNTAIIHAGGSKYSIIAGVAPTSVNGIANAGAVYVYDVDIKPGLLESYPSDNEQDLTFDTDTTFTFIFDSYIAEATGQIGIFDWGTSSYVHFYDLNQNEASVSGKELSIVVDDTFISGGKHYSVVFLGSVTDYYGLSYSSSGSPESIGFYTLDEVNPSITQITDDISNNDEYRVQIVFDEAVDTLAGVPLSLSLSAATLTSAEKTSFNTWALVFTPDYSAGQPDELQTFTYQINPSAFADIAGNVCQSVTSQRSRAYSRVWLWDGLSLFRTYNKSSASVLSTDTLIVAGDLTIENDENTVISRIVVEERQLLEIKNLASLELLGSLQNKGKVILRDSATLNIQGDFQTGDSLFVKSGASLYTYFGSSAAGLVHAERKTSYGAGRYSFIGTPFSLNTDNVGSLLGDYTYRFDPTQPYGTDGLAQWVDAEENILVPGLGYTAATGDTIKLSGIPNNGDIDVAGLKYDPSTSTNANNLGWQLLSNPYLAPIEVTKLFAENEEHLEMEAIYLWDDGGSNNGRRTNSDYLVYNSMGVVGGANSKSFDGNLMPFQAFMVKLKDSLSADRNPVRIDRTFVFKETMRTVSGSEGGDFFRATSEKRLIRLTLSNPDGLESESLIGFAADASHGFDGKYDAFHKSNASQQLYTSIGENKYCIQGIPEAALSQNLQVQLGMKAEMTGEHRLVFDDLGQFEDVDVYVVVNGNSIRVSPDQNNTITFNILNPDLEMNLEILFVPKRVLNVVGSSDLWIKPLSGSIQIVADHLEGNRETWILDLTGRTLFHGEPNYKDGMAEIEIDLIEGQVFIVRVENLTTKFILNTKF
ncbi:MAG: hypothetical protein ABJN36_08090 [Cyclobacteriaceae bacterium]